MEELENKTSENLVKPFKSNLPEQYRIEGGPGRPPGLKNKFTLLKETLLDTFNNHADKMEALERTLFFKRDDGLEYVNMEALRAILSVLPATKDEPEANTTYNFNLAITQFGKLSIDDLKSLAALARTENNSIETSAEGSSDT